MLHNSDFTENKSDILSEMIDNVQKETEILILLLIEKLKYLGKNSSFIKKGEEICRNFLDHQNTKNLTEFLAFLEELIQSVNRPDGLPSKTIDLANKILSYLNYKIEKLGNSYLAVQFKKHLIIDLKNGRKIVERNGKYTSFLLDHGNILLQSKDTPYHLVLIDRLRNKTHDIKLNGEAITPIENGIAMINPDNNIEVLIFNYEGLLEAKPNHVIKLETPIASITNLSTNLLITNDETLFIYSKKNWQITGEIPLGIDHEEIIQLGPNKFIIAGTSEMSIWSCAEKPTCLEKTSGSENRPLDLLCDAPIVIYDLCCDGEKLFKRKSNDRAIAVLDLKTLKWQQFKLPFAPESCLVMPSGELGRIVKGGMNLISFKTLSDAKKAPLDTKDNSQPLELKTDGIKNLSMFTALQDSPTKIQRQKEIAQQLMNLVSDPIFLEKDHASQLQKQITDFCKPLLDELGKKEESVMAPK